MTISITAPTPKPPVTFADLDTNEIFVLHGYDKLYVKANGSEYVVLAPYIDAKYPGASITDPISRVDSILVTPTS